LNTNPQTIPVAICFGDGMAASDKEEKPTLLRRRYVPHF
jgi:hypothetical protein